MPPPLFEPTRKAGLSRLATFAPTAGRAYALGRNTDFATASEQAVSLLSPYLRRRMITEREVVQAVLQHHSPQDAEKFIQEVFWRTYWKGWLELRPAIWDEYLHRRADALAELPDGYQEAIEGRTGIDGFDAWARELIATGWLHNHARMWFASIWIFTLKLPWVLGADFFYRHLMDADPASNTLSWRWVAGLHTRGKTYLARADNIDTYTRGRFRPAGLAPFAQPVIETFDIPAPGAPRQAHRSVPSGRYALLVTSDDLHPESWPGFAENPPDVVLGVGQLPLEASLNAGEHARAFTNSAIEDALARLNGSSGRVEPSIQALSGHLRANNLDRLVVAFANSGPGAAFLNQSLVELAGQGITVHEVKRAWDDHAWPLATAGFFKLKEKIPGLIAKAGLTGTSA